MLRGASAEALAELSQQATRTRPSTTRRRSAPSCSASPTVVRRDVALRRALTDSSVEGEAQGRAGPGGLRQGARRAGAEAWSPTPRAGAGSAASDLPDALEQVAVAATVRSAGAKGKQVGDELFAVLRMIDGEPVAARRAGRPLAHRRGPQRAAPRPPRRQDPPGHRRARGPGRDPGARDRRARPRRSTSTWPPRRSTRRSPPCTPPASCPHDEQQRLAAALGQQYGKDVQLHVVVDPSLIGGLRVEIGDDVIDGTVVSRLDDARRRLAG